MDKQRETNTAHNDTDTEICKLNPIKHETNDNTFYFEIQENGTEDISWKDVKSQIWASNVGCLFYVNDGIVLAFSNQILDEFDTSSGSWFASIIGLSIPIGSLMSGPLMDTFGRKTTNMIIGIPCIPAWFITSVASLDYPLLLYSMRFLVGFASGLAASNVVYVSEISHKKYRPALLSLVSFHFAFGILLVSILQMFMTWRQVAFFNGVFFSIALLLIALFTPESPVWLAKFKSNWDEAKKSLQWLNPNQEIFEEEWKELCDFVNLEPDQGHRKGFRLSSPTVYKPICILLVLFTLQEATFVYALIIYAIKIFPLLSPHLGEMMKPQAIAMLGITRFVANFACCLLSLRIGRRPLLLISSVGMAVTSLVLVIIPPIFVSLEDKNGFELYEWSMVTLFLLFFVFGTLGVMSIPWFLMVELLPHEARSVGSGVTLCYGYLLLFLLAKIFPNILEMCNISCLFAFILVMSAALAIFVFFYVPETWGRSFKEIEEYFTRKTWLVR